MCSDWGRDRATDILRPEFSLQPDSVTKRQPIMLTSPACIILLFFVVEVVLLEVVLSPVCDASFMANLAVCVVGGVGWGVGREAVLGGV